MGDVAAAEQALVRAYVACEIALQSIRYLPAHVAADVEEPIREFCRKLEPYVNHLAAGNPTTRAASQNAEM
jgi:hypothetical protein